MLRAAIAFFVLGLIAFALGLGGIGGLSVDIGKTLLIVFLVLAVLSTIIGLFTGRKNTLTAFLAILGAGYFLVSSSHAIADNTRAKANNAAEEVVQDTKKNARKVYHRGQEIWCEATQTDAQCIAMKAKNRGKEAVDNVKDATDTDM